MYKESVVTVEVEEDKIFGIHTAPKGILQKNITILFLHGWAGYRIGPHRMFVDYARKMSMLGFHCIRFDFRGRGGSRLNGNPNNNTMLSDLENIIEHVYEEKLPQRIVLIGICSGAKLGLFYTMKGTKPVEYIVELSTPVLRPDEKLKVEVSRSKSIVSEYCRKVIRRETWGKLAKGEIRFKLITKIIFEPILRSIKLIGKRRNKPVQNNTKRIDDAFKNFKGNILAIHGEKDPETEVSMQQVRKLAEKYSIPFNGHIVKNANHSFYSLEWKDEIFCVIKDWLLEKYSGKGNNS